MSAAVLYAAKSTEDRHGSIETQLADARALAERDGLDVVADYSDEAASAFKGNRGQGLADAMAHAERLRGGLIVQHSDRLARGDSVERGAQHLVEIVIWARRSGVTLRSVQDPQTFDPSGLVYAALMGDRNHEDSKRKGKATAAGLKRRKDRGAPVGAVPFGYAVRHDVVAGQVVSSRVVDPERAAVVEEIAAMIVTSTPGEVARMLNRRGVRTQRGGTWTARAVRQLVRNDVYTGGGGYPRILSDDVAERANRALRRMDPSAVQRRKGGRPTSEEYLLRGLVFCRCGAPLYATTGRYGSHGERHYVCKHRVESSAVCDAPPISAVVAEYRVLEHLRRFVGDVGSWLAARAVDREREQAERQLHVTRALDELVDLDRKVSRAQQRADAALERDDDIADAALRQVARFEAARDAQARAVADAEAVAAEWDAAPEEDAALALCARLQPIAISDLSMGALVLATVPREEIRAALRDALSSITLGLDDGQLRADFALRVPEHSKPVALPTLAVEVA